MNNLMRLFKPEPSSASCTHAWEITAKSYAKPANLQSAVSDLKVLEKVVFGVTTCILVCASCGEIRKEEMLGSDENQWLDIIDKVNKHGMQYIKEGGQVYGVAQWIPPLETIPVKQNG